MRTLFGYTQDPSDPMARKLPIELDGVRIVHISGQDTQLIELSEGQLQPLALAIGDVLVETNPAAAGLQPHEQRVVAEHADLKSRMDRLEAFIVSATFHNLEADARQVLRDQFAAMARLLEILAKRIAGFKRAEASAA